MLEKIWAKVVGNYEVTEGGWPSEAMRFLSGAPSATYDTSDYVNAPAAIFAIASDGDINNYVMTTSTPCASGSDSDVNKLNIPLCHAYTLIGAYNVTNSDGTLKARLLRIRNPWATDYNYNGAWNDNDTIWNTTGQTYAT